MRPAAAAIGGPLRCFRNRAAPVVAIGAFAGIVALAFSDMNALACGFCIEDKIAAVYDHAVVSTALTHKHQVAFFALAGEVATGTNSRREIEAVGNATPGVDKGSVRVSLEAATLSLAYDPVRTSFASLEDALSRKLAARRISVAILRIMDRPAELKSVTQR